MSPFFEKFDEGAPNLGTAHPSVAMAPSIGRIVHGDQFPSGSNAKKATPTRRCLDVRRAILPNRALLSQTFAILLPSRGHIGPESGVRSRSERRTSPPSRLS